MNNLTPSDSIYAETRLRLLVRQLTELNRLASEVKGVQDLAGALERIVLLAMQLLDAPGGCIYIANPEKEEVQSIVEFSEVAAKYKNVTLKYGEGAAGFVAQNRQPLIIADYRTWENRSPQFEADYPYRSVLNAPLIWKNQLVGVLQVLDNQIAGRFQETDLELLSFFASQAASIIYNASIIEAVQHQRDLAEKLAESATIISSTLDINQVLQSLLKQLAQVVPFDSASVMLVEDDCLRLVAQQGLAIPADQPYPTFPLDDPLFREIQLFKSPLILTDASQDRRFQGWLGTSQIRGWMGIPLINRGEVIGYITLDSRQAGAYQKLHADYASAFAHQAAVAIENARLFREREQRAADLEALRQASLSLTSNLELEKVLDAILQSAINLLPNVRNAHIFLYSPENEGQIQFGAALWKDGRRGQPVALPRPNGLTARVARTAQTIVVQDMSNHPLFEGMPSNWRGAIIGIPLKIGERVVGVMNVSYPTPRVIPDTELRLLGFLSDQAAIAIENANLYRQLELEKRNLSVLYDISRELAASLEPDEILQRSINLANQALGGFFGLAFRYLPDEESLSLRATSGHSHMSIEKYNKTYSWRVGQGFVGWIMQHRQADYLPDVNQDNRWLFVKGMDEGIQSAMGAPILFEDRLLGIMIIMSQDKEAFQNDDLLLMQAICQETGLALSNAERYQESQRRLQQVTLLQKLAQTFSQRLDLEALLHVVVEELARQFQYPIIEIYLVQGEELHLRASHGKIPPVQTLPTSRGLIGKAIRTKQAHLVLDVTTEPAYCADNPTTVSELVVPIILEDTVAGIINIETDQSGQLDQSDFDFFQLLADHISIALENATLYESVRQHATELEVAVAQRTAELSELFELSQKIGYAINYEDLIQILLSHLRSAVKCDFSTGCLLTDNSSLLYINSRFPLAPSAMNQLKAHCTSVIKKELGGDVPLTNIQVTLSDNYQGDQVLQECSSISHTPIHLKDKIVGLIGVGTGHEAEFSPEQLRLLQTFANQAAIALERLEAAREAEKKRLSDVVEHLPAGILLLDHDFHILVLNPLAQQQLENLQAVIENGVLKRIGNLRIQELIARRDNPLPTELFGNGTPPRIFEAQASAIGETPHQWVITLRDVTQERESQMRIQMQERLATVGQLAAGIAHDFNNIMAAILVYADLLKNEPALSQASQDRLSIIQQQVQRAASLIRQILDFSRRSVMEQSALDLLPFIKEFEKMLRRVMPETIGVELRYKPTRYMVNADPTRIQQVLMNLALNSRDAMPDGGVITLSLDRLSLKPDDPLPSEYIQPGEWITISMRDTGCGIEPENLPHIFEPFFTTKPIGLGTGLGLAQVYGIVKQHGGYIDVESKPGQGALFTIYLPVFAESTGQDQEDHTPAPMDGSGKVVLVVEDDEATRQALKTLLEVQQYTVLTAGDGQTALKIWETSEQPIDLIISDVVMPKMGGVELYQGIQKKDPRVKMLLITGHPMKEENRTILEEGSVHWLQKPFSIQEFNRALMELIH